MSLSHIKTRHGYDFLLYFPHELLMYFRNIYDSVNVRNLKVCNCRDRSIRNLNICVLYVLVNACSLILQIFYLLYNFRLQRDLN